MPHLRLGKSVLFWVPRVFWRWDGPVLATDNNPTNIAMIAWCLLFRLLGRQLGMWVEHIPDTYKGRAKLAYQQGCTRLLCALSHRVVAFSAMTVTYLRGLTDPAKIVRMIQATPMDEPAPPPRNSARLTQFGYLGSNVERKNLEALRLAFSTISDPEMTLHLAGFEEEESAQGKRDFRIRYHGYVDGAAREAFFGAIDVLILPSLADPWGFVVNEALARGALAIVTQRCGSAEMVEKIATEMVCDITSVDIARAMTHAAALPPDTVKDLRTRARAVVADYGMEAAATRFIANCHAIVHRQCRTTD
jgi:glycosyltransferase involved in cell wall biosynthesis